MTRPRAADDFATIHARLAELRRERDQATRQRTTEDETRDRPERKPLGTAETRQRPERSGWLTVAAGRRNGPGRPR